MCVIPDYLQNLRVFENHYLLVLVFGLDMYYEILHDNTTMWAYIMPGPSKEEKTT